MAQETIVFTAGGELPPDILALAEQMKPAGFTLQTLPGSASAAEIAAAMRDAEYMTGYSTDSYPARREGSLFNSLQVCKDYSFTRVP